MAAKLGLILLFWVTLLFAQEPTGFKNIAFGESKEDAIQKLGKIYGFKVKETKEYFYGENEVLIEVNNSTIILYKVALGNEEVTFRLGFNKQNQFTSIEFYKTFLPSYNQAIKQVHYFSEVLEKKYGGPQKKHNPAHEDLESQEYLYYWEWKKKEHTVYTGVNQGAIGYGAFTVIYNNKLYEDNPTFSSSKAEIIDKAVNDF